jgi:hypothetical protein
MCGKHPNPEAPGPNLIYGGRMPAYTEDQFVNTLRSGITISGRQLNKVFMPYPGIGTVNDLKLKASFTYL